MLDHDGQVKGESLQKFLVRRGGCEDNISERGQTTIQEQKRRRRREPFLVKWKANMIFPQHGGDRGSGGLQSVASLTERLAST